MKSQTILSMTAAIGLASAVSAQTNDVVQPLARIGDKAIYDDDLLPSIGAQLFQLRNQVFELKMKALMNIVNQRLLEQEAKENGLPVQALLAEKVDRRVPPPAASDIEAYYLAHKDPLGRPLAQIRAQLEETVRQTMLHQARQDYLDDLRLKAGVSILFSRPKVEIHPDPARTRGTPAAPITIVEFADFECPYCQQAEPVLAQVMDKYKGRVNLAFLDFPLRQIHRLAQGAAEAARCAAEQGRFWEYHDLLFSDPKLDPAGLREHARVAGLDMESFGACLESGKFARRVENDIQAGYSAGVSATPTFYIRGTVLVGIQSASDFEKVIDAELAAAALQAVSP